MVSCDGTSLTELHEHQIIPSNIRSGSSAKELDPCYSHSTSIASTLT